MKLLQAINTLLSTIVILIILSLLGGGVYLGYSLYESSRSAQQVMEQALAEKETELAKLSAELKVREEDLQKKETQINQLSADLTAARLELERKEREIQRLTMALQLLKVDRRVAYLDVLSQEKSEEGQAVKTTVRFVEVDEQSRPVEKPRTFVGSGRQGLCGCFGSEIRGQVRGGRGSPAGGITLPLSAGLWKRPIAR
jgi:hypothetical protein